MSQQHEPAKEGLLAQALERVASREAVIGVVGLGYVGVPLALAALRAGFRVVGFDVNAERVDQINRGEIAIRHIPTDAMQAALAEGRFEATADFDHLAHPDALLIAVPTPLGRRREPDLSFVVKTTEEIARRLRRGQLVALESTIYPGATREVVRPILEDRSGLRSGEDFFLAYSPEREDPGNPDYGAATIPKIVGADGPAAMRLADALYASFVVRTVPVSSLDAAEAVKLTENIFRAVNIALVNELKTVYEAMGVDIWEVIEAAKTKPFGYMPFYPGPGLGGHCIPIDPFYLAWKAREFDVPTRFIELAGEINTHMPYQIVDRLAEALSRRAGRALSGARVLLLGVAYKKNVEDTRESPALKLIELIEKRGAAVEFHDPFVPAIPPTREHAALAGRRSVALAPETIAACDAVLVATDHDAVDYRLVADHARLIIDTRNVFARTGAAGANIVKA